MAASQISRRRRAAVGALVAVAASLGLIAFPLLAGGSFPDGRLPALVVFGLTIAMGAGTILAVFSLGGENKSGTM